MIFAETPFPGRSVQTGEQQLSHDCPRHYPLSIVTVTLLGNVRKVAFGVQRPTYTSVISIAMAADLSESSKILEDHRNILVRLSSLKGH